MKNRIFFLSLIYTLKALKNSLRTYRSIRSKSATNSKIRERGASQKRLYKHKSKRSVRRSKKQSGGMIEKITRETEEQSTIGKQTLNLPTIKYEITPYYGILIKTNLHPELTSQIQRLTELKCQILSTNETSIGGHPKFMDRGYTKPQQYIQAYENELLPQIKDILKDFCILELM